jgi:hypothetical protein
MKTLLLLLLFVGLSAFAKQVPVETFTVRAASGDGIQSPGHGGCYLVVSDGTVSYTLETSESGFHMPGAMGAQDCYSLPPGSTVEGVHSGRYFNLLLPDPKKPGKTKTKHFHIVSVSQ